MTKKLMKLELQYAVTNPDDGTSSLHTVTNVSTLRDKTIKAFLAKLHKEIAPSYIPFAIGHVQASVANVKVYFKHNDGEEPVGHDEIFQHYCDRHTDSTDTETSRGVFKCYVNLEVAKPEKQQLQS